jgi:hypothetical protein
MYVYMYTYTHTYTHTHRHVYTLCLSHTHTHTHMYTCKQHIRMIYTHKNSHTYVYIHTYIHTYIYVCVCVYIPYTHMEHSIHLLQAATYNIVGSCMHTPWISLHPCPHTQTLESTQLQEFEEALLEAKREVAEARRRETLKQGHEASGQMESELLQRLREEEARRREAEQDLERLRAGNRHVNVLCQDSELVIYISECYIMEVE